MHGTALGWRPGGTAWSKVRIGSKTENLAPMKSMAKLQVISLRAGHYFWSFLVPGKKDICLMKDIFSPSSTDLPTSWGFSANLLENQLIPEKYPLSCWNSLHWCIGFLSVKARGWALCTMFWENNTRGFHWCQEESDGLLGECSLEFHRQSYHSSQVFTDWFSCYLLHIFSPVLQPALHLQSFTQIAPSFLFNCYCCALCQYLLMYKSHRYQHQFQKMETSPVNSLVVNGSASNVLDFFLTTL